MDRKILCLSDSQSLCRQWWIDHGCPGDEPAECSFLELMDAVVNAVHNSDPEALAHDPVYGACAEARHRMGDAIIAPACSGRPQPEPMDPQRPEAPDADGDGFSDAEDCDDSDASIYPGAEEICGNGVDDNCDDQVDEGC